MVHFDYSLIALIASLICRLVERLVGWFLGWMVCHNFLKGREVTLPCSYRRTTCCLAVSLFDGATGWFRPEVLCQVHKTFLRKQIRVIYRTSAPIGAWKRNFPPFWEIMTKPMQIKGLGNILPCIIDSLIIEQDSCEDTATSECPENFTCSDCQAMIFQHPVVQEGSNEKIRRLGNLRFT